VTWRAPPALVGLMHALAAPQAKINAVGAIGVVENSPTGKAQRPGDIVKTLSDRPSKSSIRSEGRLVSLTCCIYGQQALQAEKFMINWRTLTRRHHRRLGSGIMPACSATTISSPSG